MARMNIVDLSHPFEDGMPGFRSETEDGTPIEYTAEIKPLFTHEESRGAYDGKAAFEVTEMTFQTSVGTYLDSPYHRYPDGRDISELEIEELVLPGTVVDARHCGADDVLTADALPADTALVDEAVLFNFGWDQYWDSEQYDAYPHIGEDIIDYLLDAGVALVGVDTLNIDDHQNPARPAHTRLLDEEIFIVENLCDLDRLINEEFRFYAVPIKARETAAMPVRAFADVAEGRGNTG